MTPPTIQESVEAVVKAIEAKYGIITEPDHSDFLREKLLSLVASVREDSLEKLIEEFDSDFTLIKDDMGWVACNHSAFLNSWENFDFMQKKGSTPTEAVKNLINALNKTP